MVQMYCVVDWQAWATLATGILAVGAAMWVGRRQLEIQKQQTKLAETNLRIQLLEQRSKCISQMREVVSEWSREARLSPESMTKFQFAFQEAELLFSKATAAEMETAMNGLFWTEHWQRRSRQYHELGKETKASETLEKSFLEDDKVFEIMPVLLNKLKDESRVSDWL